MRGRVLYGLSKSDNTKHIIEEINKRLQSGDKHPLIVIVPEQYSSLYEQKIVENSLVKGMMQVEVTTFRRLASKQFLLTMQQRDSYIDNAGKSMLMYSIIQELSSTFEVFAKPSSYPSFSNKVTSLITELKRYEISYGQLYDIARKSSNQLLAQKLIEISKIYEVFEQRLQSKKFVDSDDDLGLLADLILSNKLLQDSEIWLDKFNGFTTQELRCIDSLLQMSNSVTICLSTPILQTSNKQSVFYPLIETYNKVIKLGQDKNYQMEEIFIPEKDKLSSELQFLQDEYFSFRGKTYKGQISDINIYKASSIYEEINEVAMKISQLVREGTYRYKDIVIGCPLLDEYQYYIKAIFNTYKIPFFLSAKRPITKHPLVHYIMSLLRIYDEKYSFDSVFSFLKSPFCSIDFDLVSQFENYVLKWEISGVKMYNSPFTFKKSNNIYDDKQLEIANLIREKLVNSLTPLFSEIKNANSPKIFLTSLYNFLIDNRVYEMLQQMIIDAKNNHSLDYADELKQSWNIIMTIFSQIETVLGNESLTTSKYLDLLTIAFSEYHIALVPPSNDQVEIGNILHTSSLEKKVYFVMAVNEPDFPGPIMKQGILSDKERLLLMDSGIFIAADTLSQVLEQRLVEYEVVKMVTKKLFISYSIADLSHQSRRPAYLVEQVLTLFDEIKEFSVSSYNKTDYLYSPEMGLAFLLNQDLLSKLLKKWYTDNKYEQYIELYRDHINLELSNEELANRLYGDTITTSVTRLEAYTKCPFSYFVRYGLNAKEREIFAMKPPDIGSIIHDVLGKMLQRNIVDKFLIREQAKDIFKEQTNNKEIFSRNNKLKFLSKRIIDRIVFSYEEIIRQIQKGDFEPKSFEVGFGINKEYPPVIINTETGKKIMLNGRIDRIDVAPLNDKEVFRIIDYKLSGKELKLYRIKEGIDLQLALYLYAINQQKIALPGGMYYFATVKPIIGLNKRVNDLTVDEQLHKKSQLTGFTIDDDDIKKLTDKENYEKSDVFSHKNTISNEKLNDMFTYMSKFIEEKTNEIFSLNNDVYPIRDNGSKPCEYCLYKSICGFDTLKEECRYKNITKIDDKDVIFK
ncbi:MAG: exodeoxyribonuclease V subunit gamma [Clostridiales bacterium]|nr:exodeoxyribonuclease V subunit gamma [Clostridiales bacterium]